MFLRKFRDGHLMGTTSSAGLNGAGGGGGGDNTAFLASLPEPLRAQPAFKDVKDVSDLAARWAGTQKPFAEQLPEKIRNEPYFKDIKSFDALAEKAFNQSKMIGRDPNTLFTIPAADDKEGWAKLQTALGRPEKVEGYKIPARADGKAYSPEDTAFQQSIVPKLHEIGLTQSQLDALVPVWNEMGDAQSKAQMDRWEANAASADKALRSELGAAYNEKIALAQSALSHYGSPELVAELKAGQRNGTVLGDNPHLTRLFIKLGEQLKEDGLLGKGGDGGGNELSPAEAKQQINAKMADEAFKAKWTDKNHPEHAATIAEMKRLNEMAYPG